MGKFIDYLNEANVITIDVDWVDDNPIESKKLLNKYKIKKKITGTTTADLTGDKKNLISFMKVAGYEKDLEDLYPQLFKD
jgi:hypothetical protein